MVTWNFSFVGPVAARLGRLPVDCIAGCRAGGGEINAESVFRVMSVSSAGFSLRGGFRGQERLSPGGLGLRAGVESGVGAHCPGQEMNAFLSSAGAIKSSANAIDTIRSVGATDAKCSASRSGGR